jgi:hypothetical protein
MCCGARTRCGPALRNGRSKGCAVSKSPRTCKKKYGLQPLGPADGPTETAVFGGNAARLYNFDKRADLAPPDRFAEIKADYVRSGSGRSNLRYGWVRNSG